MTVLACGSNAFRQIADSDELALSHVVALPDAAALEAASWSQSIVRDPNGELRCLGLPIGGGIPSARIKRWLGHDQFEATLDEHGVLRVLGGDVTPGAYERVEMSGRGELVAASSASPLRSSRVPDLTMHTAKDCRNDQARGSRTGALQIYDTLADAYSDGAGVELCVPVDIQRSSTGRHLDPVPHRVTSLASGAAHFLILIAGGPQEGASSVYAFGDSRYGQAGAGAPPARRDEDGRLAQAAALRSLEFFDGLGAAEVSCGSFHSAVVTRQGAFVFGSNKDGQLGAGDAPGEAEPVLVELPDEGEYEEVKQVACGGAHSVVLTNGGQVWVAGANHDGQLGVGDLLPRRTWVRNIAVEEAARADGKRIKRVVCTRASTYFECA
ncbi:hypothetical protein JCM3770_000796 [Rhodotorula araucariae]